jgi:DNA-binding SARP family transcriptional activator
VARAKPRALLAVLALAEGTAVPIDRLADGIWGEATPVSARELVRLYVAQLRETLGEEAIDRAEALRVYEQCRRLLAEELGAFPSLETESIYRGLLESPSARASVAPVSAFAARRARSAAVAVAGGLK